MSKYLPTFDELAAQRGYRRCRGIQRNGQPCFQNHKKGETHGGPEPVIHWADRRPSRLGIKQFLLLIALTDVADEAEGFLALKPVELERWRWQYRGLRRTVTYLQEAHVRVPAESWYADKTRLKSRLLDVPRTDEEREEAMAWALSG